jgi:hypothetical protein
LSLPFPGMVFLCHPTYHGHDHAVCWPPLASAPMTAPPSPFSLPPILLTKNLPHAEVVCPPNGKWCVCVCSLS